MNKPTNTFCNRTHRREFLRDLGGGFASRINRNARPGWFFLKQGHGQGASQVRQSPCPQKPPLPAKAKSVIFVHVRGPSHVDTFDHKPDLYPFDGKTIKVKTFGRGGKRNQSRVVGPKWDFKPYGECGKMVSDLFPHVGSCVDDIAFLHSMTVESPIHGSAMLMMNAGNLLSDTLQLGSWVNYGLGSVNENLPAMRVVMLDKTGGPISGAKNWSSGYMPASYQGTVLRSQGSPILDLENAHGMNRTDQRTLLNHLRTMNEGHLSTRYDNTNLAARIASYEPCLQDAGLGSEAVDLDSESEHAKSLYGIDGSRTEDFGRKCLLARRMVERGVRFIQVYSGGTTTTPIGMPMVILSKTTLIMPATRTSHCRSAQGSCRQRGPLDETLGGLGEFGRQPTAEYAKGTGRDHTSYGFTMWMAGGGNQGRRKRWGKPMSWGAWRSSIVSTLWATPCYDPSPTWLGSK